MTGGMDALVGNANLIKKVYFPREMLGRRPASRRGSFSFCIEMGVLCGRAACSSGTWCCRGCRRDPC